MISSYNYKFTAKEIETLVKYGRNEYSCVKELCDAYVLGLTQEQIETIGKYGGKNEHCIASLRDAYLRGFSQEKIEILGKYSNGDLRRMNVLLKAYDIGFPEEIIIMMGETNFDKILLQKIILSNALNKMPMEEKSDFIEEYILCSSKDNTENGREEQYDNVSAPHTHDYLEETRFSGSFENRDDANLDEDIQEKSTLQRY